MSLHLDTFCRNIFLKVDHNLLFITILRKDGFNVLWAFHLAVVNGNCPNVESHFSDDNVLEELVDHEWIIEEKKTNDKYAKNIVRLF